MAAIDAPIQYRGSLVPAEQSFEYDYDPQTGGKQTFEFDSFSEDLAVNLANTNIANRVPTKYRLEHGKATVILSDSNFPGIDTWQILANETTKSRYDAPRMLQILQYGMGDLTFYSTQIQILKNGVDNRTLFSGLGIDPSITGDDLIYLNNVYNLLLRGSDSYPFSQYVLRHTTNVGNAYAANIADVNVDKVYSFANLLTETMNGNLGAGGFIYPLPPEFQYFIQQLGLAAPAAQPGYYYGWLKRSATRTTAAWWREDLTTEYWLEQWEQTQLGSFV